MAASCLIDIVNWLRSRMGWNRWFVVTHVRPYFERAISAGAQGTFIRTARKQFDAFGANFDFANDNRLLADAQAMMILPIIGTGQSSAPSTTVDEDVSMATAPSATVAPFVNNFPSTPAPVVQLPVPNTQSVSETLPSALPSDTQMVSDISSVVPDPLPRATSLPPTTPEIQVSLVAEARSASEGVAENTTPDVVSSVVSLVSVPTTPSSITFGTFTTSSAIGSEPVDDDMKEPGEV